MRRRARSSSRPTIRSPSTTTRSCKAADLRASVRHRQFRPRHALARDLGLRGSTCRSRSSPPCSRSSFGTLRRARWSAMYGGWLDVAVRPAGRRRHHLPVPGAGHRHRRRARARPAQHVRRGRRRRLGVLRPADARPRSWCRTRRDYAAAGRVHGLRPTPASCFRHLLPNAVTPVLVYLDDRHGARHPARLEPRLSRPRRPAADGRMGRADRRRQELHDAPPGGSSIFPGIAIVLTGLGFSLLGDGLADLLRPDR